MDFILVFGHGSQARTPLFSYGGSIAKTHSVRCQIHMALHHFEPDGTLENQKALTCKESKYSFQHLPFLTTETRSLGKQRFFLWEQSTLLSPCTGSSKSNSLTFFADSLSL
jgi:hypothetical protein